MNKKSLYLGCALALGAGALFGAPVDAADHLDPSDRVSAGDAADIGDLYAWHHDDRISAVLTFAGPVAPGTDAAYSRDVLYAIHIDGADEDLEPDRTLYFRFAQNDAGEWGVWAQNVPGSDADVIGAVGTTLNSGSAMVYAGQHDDPFFFDLQGFQDTLSSGDLSFSPDRDFFEGLNINAIVVDFDIAAIGAEGPYRVWATTGEIR